MCFQESQTGGKFNMVHADVGGGQTELETPAALAVLLPVCDEVA